MAWARRPQIALRPAFSHQDVIYYQASELLPALDTGAVRPKQSVRGDPAYAPQPIISVPREVDNRRQTIVTPPQIKLDRDVPLPNVVSWPKAQLAVPIAATERATLTKALPWVAAVVEPAPSIKLASSKNAIRSLQPAVVQPTPEVNVDSIHRLGDLNIGRSQVVAPAPQLPVEAQHVPAAHDGLGSTPAVVPPPPAISSTGMANSGGRLIALNVHPAMAPVDAASGNRRGSFAASPQGKPDASGTPDIAGGGKGSEGASAVGSRSDAPPGLFVGASAEGKHSSVGGNGKGNGSGSGDSKDSVLMAKATPPRVSVPQRRAEELSGAPESELEKKVFGDRKFYAMTLSVPNLNSAAGSWVIHFAQQNEAEDKEKGPLSAPTATAMADPAYPLELMKQHIEGTVTLYAVIGSDGSVSDVRVLNGVDDRLDEYARQALLRWRFRPATKNGNPVALEAVVKVPFRPARMRSSF